MRIAEAREGYDIRAVLGVYQRRCSDPMAADKCAGEDKAGRTQEGFPRRERRGEHWHGRSYCRREGLLGEITDVWQPRSMVVIRASVVVMVCLAGCLKVKNPSCQAESS